MFLLFMLFAFLVILLGIVMETLASSDSKKQLLGWIGLGVLYAGLLGYFVHQPDFATCYLYADSLSCVLLMWVKQ